MAGQDIKMNNFPTAMDATYIYAEDANGNQIRITKDSLTSLINGLLLPVYKRLLRADIPKYGLMLTHKIVGFGCVKFDTIQYFFGSGTSSINAVCISVMAELGYNNTPRLKVITTGGQSHPMDNQGCSIAYKLEAGALCIYSPAGTGYSLATIEYFSSGKVELVSESYQTVDNLTRIPIHGN